MSTETLTTTVPFIPTSSADVQTLSDSISIGQETNDRWQQITDLFIVWGNEPELLEEDGITAPTPEAISNACLIVIDLRGQNFPPPMRVVPNGEGGIVFEWQTGQSFSSYEISHNGAGECRTFDDCVLTS